MANDLFAMKSQQRVPERKEVQNSPNEPEANSLVVQQVSVRDIVQGDPVFRHGSSSRSGTPRSREEPMEVKELNEFPSRRFLDLVSRGQS